VKQTRGRVVHIESLEDLDRRLADGAVGLRGWRVHDLDLRDRVPDLLSCSLGGATFLGCRFSTGQDDLLTDAGALVLPDIPSVPLDVYRPTLYTADELYDSVVYSATLDARAYAWAQRVPTRDDALAAALHDHAVDAALSDWARGRRIAGVMGGHAVRRGEPGYVEAVRLGVLLGATSTVATGGGPGAMEAANLGGRLAGAEPEVIDAAVATLAAVPSFRPSIQEWVRSAREVLAVLPDGGEALGVPTWFYGHEPSNLFATAIAKFVANAPREATLLELCNAGIVFLPGAAGTVQEIFQDACENFYADESSVAPMVLLGTAYWTETFPAWPLLEALARDRVMAPHVHLVDSVEEAAAALAL